MVITLFLEHRHPDIISGGSQEGFTKSCMRLLTIICTPFFEAVRHVIQKYTRNNDCEYLNRTKMEPPKVRITIDMHGISDVKTNANIFICQVRTEL